MWRRYAYCPNLNTKQYIEVELKMDKLDLTSAESKATYEKIKEYVLPKNEEAKQPVCPPEKEKAITEALKFFGITE